MVRRRSAVALALLAAGIIGCSKTQDTAPETRIFGTPPTISSVDFTGEDVTFPCDATQTFEAFLGCGGVGDPATWDFSPGPGVTITVGYTEFRFIARVTDPESTGAQSDILLVTASYTTPDDEGQLQETSLVMFDDGQENTYPFTQSAEPRSNYTCDPFVGCVCDAATFQLTTNDAVKADDLFTRGFAWVAPGGSVPARLEASALIKTCIAQERHQAPFDAPGFVGKSVEFTIEAFDRAGNQAIWPERPAGTVGNTSYACSGDECACCFMETADPFLDCRGRSGMIALPGNTLWPEGTGLCQNL